MISVSINPFDINLLFKKSQLNPASKFLIIESDYMLFIDYDKFITETNLNNVKVLWGFIGRKKELKKLKDLILPIYRLDELLKENNIVEIETLYCYLTDEIIDSLGNVIVHNIKDEL